MTFTAAQLAEKLRGEVLGDGATVLTGIASADAAQAGDLTFAEKARYLTVAEASQASAVLVSGDVTASSKVLIRVKDARVAVARVLPLFFPEDAEQPGIHPSAVVASSAKVDPTVHIGPNCVIGEGVKLTTQTRGRASGKRASSWAPAACCSAATTSAGTPNSAKTSSCTPTW